jgi:hypothetical protein
MDEKPNVIDAEPVETTQEIERAAGHGPAGIVPSGGEFSADQAIRRADEQISFRQKLTKLIATKIDPAQIVMFGKDEKASAYFTKAACQSILSWCDVDFFPDGKIEEHRYNDKNGPYIIFEMTGTLKMPNGRRVLVMGNRATNDDFFGSAHGKAVPLEEVDIASVRLACVTNLWNHALESAGLKPSLKELVDAGVKIDQLTTVDFKKKGGDGSVTVDQFAKRFGGKPQTNGIPPQKVITEAQAKRLYAIARNQGYSNEQYRDTIQRKWGVSHDRDLLTTDYKAAEDYFSNNPK